MIDPPPGYASWIFYVIARYDSLIARNNVESGFCLPEAAKHAHEEANKLMNELSELRSAVKAIAGG